MVQAWKEQTPFQRLVNGLGFLVIAAGIGISIFMNLVGRSLWVDEAMLAYSFSERPIWQLTAAPFEWLQSAPVLYLYLVKLLTLVCGNTEFVLRSFSIASFAVTLWLSWYVAKHIFHIKYAVLCPAFLANMNFMLQYANIFKQYLPECVWVLLVLVVYYLYKEERISFRPVILLYMVFLWGANPACFFIGGVLAWEFIEGCFRKKKEQVRNSFFIGAGVSVSFLTYYFYWLRDTAASEEMQNYWAGTAFPLIPGSVEDLKAAQALLYDVFITFREGRLIMMGLVLAALAIGLFLKKNRYVTVTAFGFLLCLFASYLNMFPVADRMWCFSYPLFVLLAFYAIDSMFRPGGSSGAGLAGEIAAVFLMLTLIMTNNGILVYRHAEHVFWDGEEANFSIAYVQEHLQEDESVYVYYHSIPVVKYKIGYETGHIGSGERENILWASGTANDSQVLEQDGSAIEAAGKCYLIASHTTEERFGPLLNRLRESGNLEKVQEEYGTPLYYYARDAKDSKASVAYEVVACETEEDTCYVTIRVHNTGESYINTEFDDVVLACREREDIGTNLWGNLEPGEYFDMPLSFAWGSDTSVSIQLYNKGHYWYDELGFAPLVVERDLTVGGKPE